MKKLVLKKDVVARITQDEMIYLKGGYDGGTGNYGGGEIISREADTCRITVEDYSCVMTCATNNDCLLTKPKTCAPCPRGI